jgi:hypothetical protein
MSKKLFAIPFGTDGTNGDSSFQPDMFIPMDKDTAEQLKQKLSFNEMFVDDPESLADLAGFWVIDAKIKNIIDKIDPGEIGCDSSLYRHISTVKQMIKAAAVKTIWVKREVKV